MLRNQRRGQQTRKLSALADTDNPTMRNPACTVCHSVLDPVAGTYQNYGDEGLYRDQFGDLDSLDGHYKESFVVAEETHEIDAPRSDPHVFQDSRSSRKR